MHLTVWKSHQVFSKNAFSTVKSSFYFFLGCSHLSSSCNKIKSFFYSPGSILLPSIFCPVVRSVAFSAVQLFLQEAHSPSSCLCNTLYLRNTYVKKFSTSFQMCHFINHFDNSVMNPGLDSS